MALSALPTVVECRISWCQMQLHVKLTLSLVSMLQCFLCWWHHFNRSNTNVIPVLSDILSESVKEKVTRIILATFRVRTLRLLDMNTLLKFVCVNVLRVEKLSFFCVKMHLNLRYGMQYFVTFTWVAAFALSEMNHCQNVFITKSTVLQYWAKIFQHLLSFLFLWSLDCQRCMNSDLQSFFQANLL